MGKLFVIIGLMFLVFLPKEHCDAAGIDLKMNAQWKGSRLSAGDQVYNISLNDTLKIETLRFYYSNVELKEQGKTVWKESNSYHLYDLDDTTSFNIHLNIPAGLNYDAISFLLGIDSLTNVSGAMGGALDPTKGMYWTWQTGYINMKVEGTSAICPSRKHQFAFHIGGYSGVDNSAQQIDLKLIPGKEIVVGFNLDQFLSGIDLRSQHQLMSPGPDAVKLAKQAVNSFYTIKP
jgi:hypothetical protein